MSESIYTDLKLKQIGKFSFSTKLKATKWVWTFIGYVKYDIGFDRNSISEFLIIESDICPDLLKKIYKKSSDEFKKNHIKIIKSSDCILGVEMSIFNLAIDLQENTVNPIEMISSEIREAKINKII